MNPPTGQKKIKIGCDENNQYGASGLQDADHDNRQNQVDDIKRMLFKGLVQQDRIS